MTRKQLIKLLRDASQHVYSKNGCFHNKISRDLDNAANSLVVLKEPLMLVQNLASENVHKTEEWTEVPVEDYQQYKKAVGTIREFNNE
jgi:hypothetical protein